VKLLAIALVALALALPASGAPMAKESTLPPAVTKTRTAILAAARAHDYAALARVIGTHKITFTYGSPTGGPIAYWKRVEREGGKPLAAIAGLLKQPGVKFQGNYVWPRAYAKSAGRWLFFVRGD
jgi:hypothetical protein